LPTLFIKSLFPKQSHGRAIKQIVRYLKGTRTRGLIMRPTAALTLDCYVDADFAGLWGSEDPEEHLSVRSRTGYVLTLGGCPVSWCSKLQTEVALSTMEAEYIALSHSMRDLLPMQRLLAEVNDALGLSSASSPSTVYEDNTGALTLANLPRLTPRSKHIAVKYHFFRQHVADGSVRVVKISTNDQLADIFTKGLTRQVFESLRFKLLGW
jgi:hypothetical protein